MWDPMPSGSVGTRAFVNGGADFKRKAFHLRKGFLYFGYGSLAVRSAAGDELGCAVSLTADTLAPLNMFGNFF